MSETGTSILRWQGGELRALDYCDPSATDILAADSWLVTDGDALAIDVHRERFFHTVARQAPSMDTGMLEAFWQAAIAEIPREGEQFPRVELQNYRGSPLLVFRQRPAPERRLSVTVATHAGADPRTAPTIKGPDTHALLRIRGEAQQRGAEEAVITSPHGFVVEGAFSAVLWWRGGELCAPALDLERVDSVTAKTVITLATALGVEVYYESVTPAQLEELEVWALSALHGIRIVNKWVDGPRMAEEPGRLALWRSRLDRLRKPLG